MVHVQWKLALATLLALGAWLVPDVAHAAAALGGGGAMPYSPALQILRTSFAGEVAGILIIVGVIGALYYWLFGGELGQVMAALVKVAIIGCIIGGTATGLTWMGTAGAVV